MKYKIESNVTQKIFSPNYHYSIEYIGTLDHHVVDDVEKSELIFRSHDDVYILTQIIDHNKQTIFLSDRLDNNFPFNLVDRNVVYLLPRNTEIIQPHKLNKEHSESYDLYFRRYRIKYTENKVCEFDRMKIILDGEVEFFKDNKYPYAVLNTIVVSPLFKYKDLVEKKFSDKILDKADDILSALKTMGDERKTKIVDDYSL